MLGVFCFGLMIINRKGIDIGLVTLLRQQQKNGFYRLYQLYLCLHRH